MSSSPLLGPHMAEYEANLETVATEYFEELNGQSLEDEEVLEDDDAIFSKSERLKHQDLHWLKRPSVFMVGIIVFLFALALGMSAATHKVLEIKLTCNYLGAKSSKDGVCDPAEVQLVLSNLSMACSILGNIVMLAASGKVSAMSDRYGRKIFLVMVITTVTFGRTVRYLIMSRWDTLHFGMMVFSEVVTNLGGSDLSLMALLNCYVADVVDPQHRIYYLSLSVSASLLIGAFFGPLVGNAVVAFSEKLNGGLVANNVAEVSNTIHSYEYIPIKAELAILTAVSLFTIFVLPESRSEAARKRSKSSVLSDPISATTLLESQQSWITRFIQSINFLHPLKLLIIPDEYLRNVAPSERNKLKVGVFFLVIIDTLSTAVKVVLGEIAVLYGIYRFGWTQAEIGSLISVSCISSAFALIAFLPAINSFVLQKLCKLKVLRKSFDMVDFGITSVGLTSDALGMVFMYFSTTTVAFMVTLAVSSLGAISAPTLNSAIVKFYPESKIGELYGALALLKNLLGLVTPLIFLSMYKFFIAQWDMPQLVFSVYAVFWCFLLVVLVTSKTLLGLNKYTATDITRSNSMISYGPSEEEQDINKAVAYRVNVEDIEV